MAGSADPPAPSPTSPGDPTTASSSVCTDDRSATFTTIAPCICSFTKALKQMVVEQGSPQPLEQARGVGWAALRAGSAPMTRARDLAASPQLRAPAPAAPEPRRRGQLRSCSASTRRALGDVSPSTRTPAAHAGAAPRPSPALAGRPDAALSPRHAPRVRPARVPAEDEVHRAADAQRRPEEVEAERLLHVEVRRTGRTPRA